MYQPEDMTKQMGSESTSKKESPWYFGNISRQESKDLLLEHGKEGDFIVRQSSYVSLKNIK